MAIDTNFASLFDKLKVEDPWLPPSTWESIPSENGGRPSSSNSLVSPQPPVYHLSSVSEASLVRLAFNCMQGLQSALVSIQKLSAAFCTDPTDRSFRGIPSLWNRASSTHALGKILNSMGCFGCLVFLLRKFVDNFMNKHLDVEPLKNGQVNSESANQSSCESDTQKEQCLPYSLVNQAFAVAVGKILEGYVCALNTVHASVRLRHSSEAANVPLNESAFLTSIVHSEITLLEIYLHTKELRTQIEALGNICNLYDIAFCFSVSSLEVLTAKAALEISKFCRGGDLLTYLYTQLQVADPAHLTLLKFLFIRSCEPYCGFVRSWIFRAEISDPYKEFIVECVNNLPPNLHCSIPFEFPLASIRDGVAVPCFLKDFLIPIIRAGQQLQVLMKLLELCDYVGPGDHTYEDFLPSCSGYLINCMVHASPMTFNKAHLRDLVTSRKNYYSKMQEKLESLLTKLEFRCQQVPLRNATSFIFDNSGEGLENEVSFSLNSPAADKWISNVDVDKICSKSSERDGSDWFDTSEASDCSSLTGSDEQNEAEQEFFSNNFADQEQQYLFSLRFSVSSSVDNTFEKSTQRKDSQDMQSNLPCYIQKNNALDHFMQSYGKEKSLRHMFEPPGLAVRNLSGIPNNQYTDGFTDKCRSLGLSNNLLYNDDNHDDDVCRYYQRLDSCSSSLEVDKADKDSVIVNAPCFRKMTSKKVVSDMNKNQLKDAFNTPSYFTLQMRKDNFCSDFLSKNPSLTKNAFLNSMNKPGWKCSSAYGHSLSYFDFSTVENPLEVFEEKLTSSSRRENGYQVHSTGKSYDQHKHDNSEDSVLVNNARTISPSPPLDPAEQGREAFLLTNVSGGKSWESLLNNFSYTEKECVRKQNDSSLGAFDIPLNVIIEKCLLQEILLQYRYVSKLAIKLLEGFDLHEHLLALRRYHFMELADWADLFIKSLSHHKWHALEADQRVSEIHGFLEMSVQRSSCERDPNKDRLFVYIKENATVPLSTSSIGLHSFDFLGLGYRVDWPVSIVLTPGTLKVYADIFSFLVQVKVAVCSLSDVWFSSKDMMRFIGKSSHSTEHKKEVDQFNMLIKMRHQVNHFVSTLQQYVLSQLSHISWCRFLNNLKHKVKDMMDLEVVHMEYLTDSLHICFLSDETRTIASIIERILQCALEFRSCLTPDIGHVVLNQVDLRGELSQINMSQVFSIRQKFNKNMKELHQCYLRSPKHREFGLSCFWGYLNYNQYFADT